MIQRYSELRLGSPDSIRSSALEFLDHNLAQVVDFPSLLRNSADDLWGLFQKALVQGECLLAGSNANMRLKPVDSETARAALTQFTVGARLFEVKSIAVTATGRQVYLLSNSVSRTVFLYFPSHSPIMT